MNSNKLFLQLYRRNERKSNERNIQMQSPLSIDEALLHCESQSAIARQYDFSAEMRGQKARCCGDGKGDETTN
jgi:hypothetical protein